MAQVIIVSNRLPVSIKKIDGKLHFTQSLGGVATGLSSYLSKRKNSLWIGWPGIVNEELTLADKQIISVELSKWGYIPVFLSKHQVDNFYNGYSNSVLWQLFHGLPADKISASTSKIWWNTYKSVNNKYAEIILHFADDNAQVWVQDYQLMLVPENLRKNKLNINIGFFLHIPFPSPVNYFKSEHSIELLKGVLGSDLIGFHTNKYVENFVSSLNRVELIDQSGGSFSYEDRIVRISEYPMGIDYEKFSKARTLKPIKNLKKQYEKKYKGLKVIVSIDRLDPSKGLIERLKAYRYFLKTNPKWKKKIILVMVAAPSRSDIPSYIRLSKSLSSLVKSINKEFGSGSWLPIDYINEPLPFDNVNALLQIADVAFITPLIDGMNLVAKEFVASNMKKGVLILSSTAGASTELQDAVIVDPRDQLSQVHGIETALKMSRRELKKRLSKMKRYLSSHTVQSWAVGFIDTLNQPVPGTPNITKPLNKHFENQLLRSYRQSFNRLLFLDYDGSLVPLKNNYHNVNPSKQLDSLLKELAVDANNNIVVISGRDNKFLEKHFGKLNINLVAEHGANIKKPGSDWVETDKDSDLWKHVLLPTLVKYADITPGASVEVKPHSIVWHYRGASPYHAQKYAVIIKRSLKPALTKYELELVHGSKMLEIKSKTFSKGSAAAYWLNQNYDFVMAIGDDYTDEELFSALPQTAYTIKIGRGLTKARYRLISYKETLKLLAKLT